MTVRALSQFAYSAVRFYSVRFGSQPTDQAGGDDSVAPDTALKVAKTNLKPNDPTEPSAKEKRIESIQEEIKRISQEVENAKEQLSYKLLNALLGTPGNPFFTFRLEEIQMNLARFIEAVGQFVKQQKRNNPWIRKDCPNTLIQLHPLNAPETTSPDKRLTDTNWRKAKLAQQYDVNYHFFKGADGQIEPGLFFFLRHYLATVPLPPPSTIRANVFHYLRIPLKSASENKPEHAVLIQMLPSAHYLWLYFQGIADKLIAKQQNRIAAQPTYSDPEMQKIMQQYKPLTPSQQNIAHLINTYTQRFEALLHHPVNIFQLAAVQVHHMAIQEEENVSQQAQNQFQAQKQKFEKENRGKWVQGSGMPIQADPSTLSGQFLGPWLGDNPVSVWFELQSLWDKLLASKTPDALRALQEMDDQIILDFPPVRLAQKPKHLAKFQND